jgi:hypothetical protein
MMVRRLAPPKADDWHFEPGCPRWPHDGAPGVEKAESAELARGEPICPMCVKIGGDHRGRRDRH